MVSPFKVKKIFPIFNVLFQHSMTHIQLHTMLSNHHDQLHLTAANSSKSRQALMTTILGIVIRGVTKQTIRLQEAINLIHSLLLAMLQPKM